MRTTLLSIFAFFIISVHSQVVTTTPAFPTVSESIDVYFNADQGSKGLKDYAGDVYVHTGLITGASSNNSDWKYVIAEWSENTSKNKLERLSANQYKFTISPDILTFYAVKSGDKVLKLAFVFRSADGSKTGKTDSDGDIFVDVYTNVVNVKINSPLNNAIIKINETVNVNVESNLATSTSLFVNNQEVQESTASSIDFAWTPTEKGNYTIKAIATDGKTTVLDSVQVLVYESTPIASLPSGAKKGLNFNEDGSVTFVLYAPYKQTVILKGDMTDWQLKEEYLMNRNPEGTHYWITLSGLDPNYEYAYQYVVDGNIIIADPYTEKVLDPWNDKYIESATYPDLKAYPEGKTVEIASTFKINDTKYKWKSNNFIAPKNTDLVIYELHVRDFVASHRFSTIVDTLNYLKKLGVNAVEFMPVNEFEGNDSWGYNPSFYFALDKYYGPKNEFKRLIDSCHANGMAVIIDMVLNHSFGQSPFLRLYANGYTPTTQNPWYNVSSPNPVYYWGADFNHERPIVQELVDSINSYWMNEYKVDGFRFDFTKGFTQTYGDGQNYDASRISVLKRMASEIWKRNSDAIVIFEHLADNREEKVLAEYGILLWGNFNHAYAEGAMGYNIGNSNYNYVSYKWKDWSEANLVGYMESHDEERVQYKNTQWGNKNGEYDITDDTIGWQRLELNACFFFTIPGPKMIWQFGELGYDYSIDYNGRVGRKPIEWAYYNNPFRKRIYDTYSVLADLKVDLPVFKTSNFIMDTKYGIKRISLFDTSMNIMVIGNFEVTMQILEAKFPAKGVWYELFSQTSILVADTAMKISLKPGEYRLYSTKKITHDALPEYLWKQKEQKSISELKVFPVPSNGFISIENYEAIEQLELYSISGDRCVRLEKSQITETVDFSGIRSGLYFLRAKTAEGKWYTAKVMFQSK